jgi:hypothetical protein
MRHLPRLLLSAAACCLAACSAAPRQSESGPALAQTAAVDPGTEQVPYTLERFRDERKLGEGVQTVVLDNPYGEIQIRQTSANALAIQGVEQRIGAKPREARIEWFEEGGRQGVRIRYAEHDPNQSADPQLGRVDLYAFVPPKVTVETRSDFGAIFVRRIDNDVVARSSSGPITVAARGGLDLESVTGELRAYPMGFDSSAPVRLRSQSGILADVPLSGGLELRANAATGIRADFELDSLVQNSDGRWQAELRTAAGGRRIEVESLEGDVLLQGVHPPEG